ncbi:MAG TPA: hypothetical protein VJR89_38495, partial [Polyangiales bacterium]|nr:hypothetical protein [Polyangiales bacterium]
MAAFRYAPPADQNDLAGTPNEEEFLETWSQLIADQFRFEISTLKKTLRTEPSFFTELDHAVDRAAPIATVPWVGFPRAHLLATKFDRAAALTRAENRGEFTVGYRDAALTKPIQVRYRDQDEYLEWVAIREKNGELRGFHFTAEGPEYWEHLAAVDREAVRSLCASFTGRNVALSELTWAHDVWAAGDSDDGPVRIYRAGDYNPYNDVNLDECAAHLTHPANTLGAEIDLAAKATVQRLDAQRNLVSERRRLACCSNFGDPNRNSDPTIGAAVNQAVRAGASLTLADPVGLYIQTFDASRVATREGEPVDWWRIVRGSSGRVLRATFAPPAGSSLGMADVVVGDGEPLRRGGQLAELT